MSSIFKNSSVALDGERTATSVACWVTNIAVSTSGPLSICLSGGSTPRALYRMLAEPPFVGMVPWSRIHWFWGDERFVPMDHPDSNFRMAREAMLDRVAVPFGHIHPVDTTLANASEAAAAYDRMLQAFRRNIRQPAGKDALFDVVLLGLGEDGHTASLFPETPTLTDTTRLVASIEGARPEPRVTLTYSAIDSSEHVAFIVCGSAKQDIVRALHNGADLPAARVTSQGDVAWFFDTAAVGDILHDVIRSAHPHEPA